MAEQFGCHPEKRMPPKCAGYSTKDSGPQTDPLVTAFISCFDIRVVLTVGPASHGPSRAATQRERTKDRGYPMNTELTLKLRSAAKPFSPGGS